MVARHEVFVIADPSFGPALDPAIKHLPFDATTWRYNPVALWRLRRILKKIQPDVIHAQANKAAYMANLCGVRATINVATVHNQKNDTKPFGRFDGVIAVSTAAGARLDHPHIAIIPNGITTPPSPEASVIAQLRAQWCPTNEPMTIAVGRLVAAKGFDILLQAWRDLPGKLIIIGSGPDEGKLKNLHAELALGERVVFTGYRKDVPLFMAAADLLVIASRREGFPYVLIEALHTGIPIISTDIPGAAEFLPPEAVIRTEDSLALHFALQKALGQHDVLNTNISPTSFALAQN